jgi:hypothetical protein
MEDLKNVTIYQVHVVVDIYVKQQSSDILDDPNDSNFCGYDSTLASIGYVNSHSITIDVNDAPSSPLMDSIASLKVKIAKGKRVGAHTLTCSTSGVKGRARALRWD